MLSFSFVAIIATQGLLEGMNDQVAQAMIDTEYAGGQYWYRSYDPYDPLSLSDAHGRIPAVSGPWRPPAGDARARGAGVLSSQGRVRPVVIKGIDPAQQVVRLPSSLLRGRTA